MKLLGGACVYCGYNNNIRALEIDHLVSIRRKSSGVRGASGTVLWQKVANGRIPIKEVQLICSNCHSIKTYNEQYGIDMGL